MFDIKEELLEDLKMFVAEFAVDHFDKIEDFMRCRRPANRHSRRLTKPLPQSMTSWSTNFSNGVKVGCRTSLGKLTSRPNGGNLAGPPVSIYSYASGRGWH